MPEGDDAPVGGNGVAQEVRKQMLAMARLNATRRLASATGLLRACMLLAPDVSGAENVVFMLMLLSAFGAGLRLKMQPQSLFGTLHKYDRNLNRVVVWIASLNQALNDALIRIALRARRFASTVVGVKRDSLEGMNRPPSVAITVAIHGGRRLIKRQVK
jgi:hypothetical protein